MGIASFKASLRYAVRNRQTVTIGGGEYPAAELVDVLAALDCIDDREALRLECERLRGSKERFRLEAVAANGEADVLKRELVQARKERDAAHRRALIHQGDSQRLGARLEGLERVATAIGQCRAFDVSAPILQAFIRLDAGDDLQADADRMAATLAPGTTDLVAQTVRYAYWRMTTCDGSPVYVATSSTAVLPVSTSGGYPRLDALMRLKGETETVIRGNTDAEGRHK